MARNMDMANTFGSRSVARKRSTRRETDTSVSRAKSWPETMARVLCVGNWEFGKREGFGTFYYANGAVYKGEWSGNLKHGQGIFMFQDGNVHEGTFTHDKFDGLEKSESGFGRIV